MHLQKTIYDAGNLILTRLPVLDQVEIHMPNIHYFPADLSKLGMHNDGEVHVCRGIATLANASHAVVYHPWILDRGKLPIATSYNVECPVFLISIIVRVHTTL